MRSGQETDGRLDQKAVERTGDDLERHISGRSGLYAVLAVLVWFTMGEGKVLVLGKPVDLRLLPLVITRRAGVEDGIGAACGKDSPRRGEGSS